MAKYKFIITKQVKHTMKKWFKETEYCSRYERFGGESKIEYFEWCFRKLKRQLSKEVDYELRQKYIKEYKRNIHKYKFEDILVHQ